jgi:hypothetical protein
MRLAICLSGQPRTWRHTYKTLFNFFDGHALDVFIHTWDDIEASELEAIRSAYSPRTIVQGARPLFLDEKRAMATRFPESPPFSILDMFHAMAASIGLALNASAPPQPAYDLICRTRFDTIYDGRWRGEPPPKGAIAVQTGEFEPPGGCNDQFALGEPDAMRLYAGVSAWLPEGIPSLTPPCFRPEIALQAYLLNACGLTIHRERFALTLLRDYQVGQPFSALQDDPLHHARKREDWEAFAKSHMAPEISGKLDFRHYGRLPLMMDKWLHAKPPEVRQAVLTGDWANRIVAIDALLQGETGAAMDPDRYRLVRLVDAALINRMSRDEPMSLESFIVHAVSANLQDMKRALAWALEDESRLDALSAMLNRLPALGAAYRFAQPFQQSPTVGWRALDNPVASEAPASMAG